MIVQQDSCRRKYFASQWDNVFSYLVALMVLLKAWIVVHFLTFCFFLTEESVSWAASLYCHGWAIHTVGKDVISQDDSLCLPFGRNRASISNFLSSLVFTGSQESWSRAGFKTQLQTKHQSQTSSWVSKLVSKVSSKTQGCEAAAVLSTELPTTGMGER